MEIKLNDLRDTRTFGDAKRNRHIDPNGRSTKWFASVTITVSGKARELRGSYESTCSFRGVLMNPETGRFSRSPKIVAAIRECLDYAIGNSDIPAPLDFEGEEIR